MGSIEKPFWQSKVPDDLNSRIMLTALLSLALVTLLVLILHLYARYALRRDARHQMIRTSQVTITQINAGDPPKAGLDPAIIASLPLFAFKQANNSNEDDMETECAVCLSKFEEEDMVRTLPNCNHTFHAECVDMWLGSNSTCPICRAEAEPKPESTQKAVTGVESTTGSTLEHVGISILGSEETSAKVVGSVSRLSSLRRMLSRERSSRRIQSRGGEEHGTVDLERQ